MKAPLSWSIVSEDGGMVIAVGHWTTDDELVESTIRPTGELHGWTLELVSGIALTETDELELAADLDRYFDNKPTRFLEAP